MYMYTHDEIEKGWLKWVQTSFKMNKHLMSI